MVTRIGGSRRKTRRKFAKNIRQRGKISLRSFFQEFKKGDMVCFKAEPAVQKGMYFRRYHGKAGQVIKRRGSCYEIKFKDGGTIKTFVVHPVHLKRQ